MRTTIILSILLVPLTGHTDPRAAMMMGAAWMQSRQPARSVATPQPMTLFRPTVKRVVKPKPVTKTKPVTKAKPVTKVQSDNQRLMQGAWLQANKEQPVLQDPSAAAPGSEPTGDGVRMAAALESCGPAGGASRASNKPRGWFGNVMHNLGRIVGQAFRGRKSGKSAVAAAGKKRGGYVIPINSMPVGLLLTPYRQGTLNRPLNPQTLVDLKQARLISDREYEMFMGQAMMMGR